MIKELGCIDYTNPKIRNFYEIKESFVSFLERHKLSLFVNVDENKVIIYDKNGNDLEHMTLKQLTRRIKLSWLTGINKI